MISYIRRLLDKILSPVIEPIIDSIGDGISKNEHENLIFQIEKYKQPYHKGDIEPEVKNIEQVLLSGSNQDKMKLELRCIENNIKKLVSNDKTLIRKLSNQSLPDLFDSKQKEYKAYRSIYLAIESLVISQEDILRCNEILMQTVQNDQWEAPKKIVFGRSFILLYLMSSYRLSPNPDVKEYLEVASERILRIFEIRQEVIINFSEESHSKIELLAEQLRLINFLLKSSDIFEDIRFLNASLKANDRIMPMIKKICSKSDANILNNLILSYYRENILSQESKMRNLI